MNTDYKAALQTVRRMLNENFYGDEYVISWIDSVIAGQQNPAKSMTPEVEKQFRDMTAD